MGGAARRLARLGGVAVKLRWMRRALDDMRRCAQEIALISPRAAVEVVDRLIETAEALRDARGAGRPIGRGLLELRIAGSRLALVYRRNEAAQRLEILHIAQAEEAWGR